MRLQSLALALTSGTLCLAVPLDKKANYDPLPGGDIDILNYALTLEYLERKFYAEGLHNYTAEDFAACGFDHTFYKNLKEVYGDEKVHVDFLAGALGPKAVKEAMYSFPSTDAKSFVTLAAVLEGVGVSAYLGAAAVIADKTYVPIAGAILTVEARHASYIRAALGESPFPKPFDTPLNFNQVFSLAAQFITGFAPGDPPLPFKAFPPLTAMPGKHKDHVVFKSAYAMAKDAHLVDEHTPVYAVFFSGLDTYYVPTKISGSDYKIKSLPTAGPGQLPPSGQVYVVLSTASGEGKSTVSDENTLSGVAILEI